MTTGELIRKLRRERHLTQEKLGAALTPPVNRAAVHKWEAGYVTNIKKEHIEQIAKLFNITPAKLMCFDTISVEHKSTILDEVQKMFGKDSVKMLLAFNQLNDAGKRKVLEHMDDIIELSKYKN